VRLASFSLERFRSIVKAHKLRFGDLTILIGPNNEGKSNILRGLVTGMRILESAGRMTTVRGRFSVGSYREDEYEWDRDFPVGLQSSLPDGKTVLDFEFELTPEELSEFKSEVKSSLVNPLPIRLSIGASGAEFKVRGKGAGGPHLTSKRDAIAQFIGSKLRLQYIRSIRTAEDALDVVNQMISLELRTLERTPDYRNAVAKIEKLQTPILESLAETVRDSLATFLPDVTDVQLAVPSRERFGTVRRHAVMHVNDGTMTDLSVKGDGVQSLAAISLIRHVSARVASGRELMLAIEEPEAHLHPEAVHQLRSVLQEIAAKQQVFVTTHSPLLVNREDIGANILVEKNLARPASSVEEIRGALGVRTSDNLRSARLVLLVEGECDRVSLRRLLCDRSDRLRDAIQDGELAFEPLFGVGNLSYKLTQVRDGLCSAHVFVDNDKDAIEAVKIAQSRGLLAPSGVTYASAPGLKESEFEDLVDLDLYSGVVLADYNVKLGKKTFKSNKGKWSKRMAATFQDAGQLWDSDAQVAVKTKIARLVEVTGESAILPARAGSLDALASTLEDRLGSSESVPSFGTLAAP